MKYITFGMLFFASFASAHMCDSTNCERIADRLITQDSRGWSWNRYDVGSATLSDTISDLKNGNEGFKVNYTYNNGRQGWAKMIFTRHGDFICVAYHDFPNTCRGLR